MTLKVNIVLTLLVFIGTACAFTIPLPPEAGPAATGDPAEIVADEPADSPAAPAPSPTGASPSPGPTPEAPKPIVLPISVYILDDEAGQLSSARSTEQLEEVYNKVNDIWRAANIIIEVRSIRRISLPPDHLEAISNGNFSLFFGAARSGELEIPDPSLLNGFYAQGIGGPNGITPFNSRAFFVTDSPSVHSERVTSHEIGHILGLHHALDDPNRLMFSGTNGMGLSEEEITVARYAARGLLRGVR